MKDRYSGVLKALLDRISEYAWPKPLAEEVEMLTGFVAEREGAATATGEDYGAQVVLPLLSLALTREPVELTPGRPLALLVAGNAELTRLKDGLKAWRAAGLTAQFIYDRTTPYLAKDRLGKGLHLVCATPAAAIRLMREDALRLDQAKFLVMDNADKALDADTESLTQLCEAALLVGAARFGVASPEGMGGLAELLRSASAHTGTLEVRDAKAQVDAEPVEEKAEEKIEESKAEEKRDDKAPPKLQKVEWAIPAEGEHYVFVPTSRMQSFLEYLLARIDAAKRIVVYAMTRDRADFAKNACAKVGLEPSCLHSMLDPEEMIEAIRRFTEGQTRVMVMTDACVRFFDLPSDAVVLNFDLPRSVELFNLRNNRVGDVPGCALTITFVHPSCAELLPRYAHAHGRTIEPDNPYEVNVRSREDFSRDFEESRSKRAAKRQEKRQGKKAEKAARAAQEAGSAQVAQADAAPESAEVAQQPAPDVQARVQKTRDKKNFKKNARNGNAQNDRGNQSGQNDQGGQNVQGGKGKKGDRKERFDKSKDARKKDERNKGAQKSRWDDDNFGNSIHYQPKKRNLRNLASDQPIHWEPTDPFHPSAQALSLPQLMPDERRMPGAGRPGGKKGGNGRGGFNRR